MTGIPESTGGGGGYLSNVRIASAQDKQVVRYESSSNFWINDNLNDIVALAINGTGLYASGNGSAASPLTFDPIQVASLDDSGGAGQKTLIGDGVTGTPLQIQWPYTTLGDIVYWNPSTPAIVRLGTGGSGNSGYVLTVNGSGIPQWLNTTPNISNSGYVFPDASHANTSINPNSWTNLNGGNSSPSYPYATGGIFSTGTLQATIPATGWYEFKASVKMQTITGATLGAVQSSTGFNLNGSTPDLTGGVSTVYIGGGSNGLDVIVVWERHFTINDVIVLQGWENGGAAQTMSCNFMSCVPKWIG